MCKFPALRPSYGTQGDSYNNAWQVQPTGTFERSTNEDD